MDTITEFLLNSAGQYDLGSLIKLFTLMIGVDGIIGVIYVIFKAAHGR